MPELRPLPPVPNIEFERKEAKLLLRQLRAGDHKATERARIRHSAVSHIYASDFKLADAQLTIAREYGFASWPRMVRYFSTAERQRHRKISHTSTPSGYEHHARALLAAHAKRRTYVGRTLAEYVPRFFGVPLTAVFDATVTEEEAKLAVAREAGFPTWDVLLAKASEAAADHYDGWPVMLQVDARLLAIRAIRMGDLAALQEIVRQHPELLNTRDHRAAMNDRMLDWALGGDRELGQAAMRPIMQWLALLGFDATRRLNEQLCGSRFLNASDVQPLLDRGGDPNWVAPNGISETRLHVDLVLWFSLSSLRYSRRSSHRQKSRAVRRSSLRPATPSTCTQTPPFAPAATQPRRPAPSSRLRSDCQKDQIQSASHHPSFRPAVSR